MRQLQHPRRRLNLRLEPVRRRAKHHEGARELEDKVLPLEDRRNVLLDEDPPALELLLARLAPPPLLLLPRAQVELTLFGLALGVLACLALRSLALALGGSERRREGAAAEVVAVQRAERARC